MNFLTCFRGLETKGSKWKMSCILKRIVRVREAKRVEQNSSSGCDEGWRDKEEVSSNTTLNIEQVKDKLWEVIYNAHMKFILLWLLSSLKKHLQGFSNMFRYFCWHLMENTVVTLLFIFHLLSFSVKVFCGWLWSLISFGCHLVVVKKG